MSHLFVAALFGLAVEVFTGKKVLQHEHIGAWPVFQILFLAAVLDAAKLYGYTRAYAARKESR